MVHLRGIVTLTGVLFLTVACGVSHAEPSGPPAARQGLPAVSSGTAADTLTGLPVKGRAPMTGYSRDQFGPAWKDVDGNGCDTRSDILARDLVERQMSGRCTVLSGVLYPDPYTGQSRTYVRGKSVVDIDHMVAIGNAWVTGGQRLTVDQRTALANDPLNLLAVDSSANRQKSDGDAATWLPANKAFRCSYIARQIAVKAKYGLWVTSAEKDAMARVLAGCPGEPLPASGAVPVPVAGPGGEATSPAPASAPSAAGDSGHPAGWFRTCASAHAAGVTPLHAGTPAYAANTHLDRNHDGIACA